jgi:CHAD domain-containing protein
MAEPDDPTPADRADPVDAVDAVDAVDVDAVVGSLGVGPAARVVVERTWYDTFDWRVHGAGAVLEHERGEGGSWLRWLPLGADAPDVQLQHDEPPRWAADLPAGALRDRLVDVVDVRALLPLATARVVARRHRHVDGEDKTVARLLVEDAEVVAVGDAPLDAPLPLGTVLRVEPLRGYTKQAHRLADALAHRGLEPSAADALARRAFTAIGRRPGDRTSKLKLTLERGQRADVATAHVLRTLLDAVEVNRPGTIADVDPEFLHDLRVAVRRSRSVLGRAEGVIPEPVRERARAELGDVQRLTGDTRDLDVALLDFDELAAALPADVRPDLEPLREFLKRAQRAAQAQLADALVDEHWTPFATWWRDTLGAIPGPDAPDGGAEPVEAFAAEHIAKAHKKVIRMGRAIDADSPAEDLHELRKKAKVLRYLLEVYGSLFPAGEVKPLVTALKDLQDNLGEHQDRAVQAESLVERAREVQAAGTAPADTFLAIGRLVEHLHEAQEAARAEFADRFAAFDVPEVRRRVRALGEKT